jgi:hypothetical protein
MKSSATAMKRWPRSSRRKLVHKIRSGLCLACSPAGLSDGNFFNDCYRVLLTWPGTIAYLPELCEKLCFFVVFGKIFRLLA